MITITTCPDGIKIFLDITTTKFCVSLFHLILIVLNNPLIRLCPFMRMSLFLFSNELKSNTPIFDYSQSKRRSVLVRTYILMKQRIMLIIIGRRMYVENSIIISIWRQFQLIPIASFSEERNILAKYGMHCIKLMQCGKYFAFSVYERYCIIIPKGNNMIGVLTFG